MNKGNTSNYSWADQIFYDAQLAEELKTVKDRVLWIVEHYPSVKKNYTLLVFIYLRKFEGINIPYVEWEKLSNIKVETITRAFRKLVEEGKVDVPEDVRRLRRKREEAFRRVLGNKMDEL